MPIILLVNNGIGIGLAKYFLNMARGEEFLYKDLFYGFKSIHYLLKIVIITVLISILVGLGFLLFVIPGIILSFMFSQVYYILIDNEEM
ncbi:MAG: hypothetical protein R3Y64_00860 [Peptostreptococcaceae bacterium]